MIVKESQNVFGDMYLGGKKTISSDVLFIVTNIAIYYQGYSAEIDGLLYTTLSGKTFKNKIINI